MCAGRVSSLPFSPLECRKVVDFLAGGALVGSWERTALAWKNLESLSLTPISLLGRERTLAEGLANLGALSDLPALLTTDLGLEGVLP
ncbi:hypothetical protein BKA80DRAFT_270288 [Phyllosticta citrichinensis]